MLRVRLAPAVAAMALAGLAYATDNHIPLNYNWNGMVHSGEGGSADDPAGFRSISDRALWADPVNPNSIVFGTVSGSTGLTYTFEQNANVFDIVHLGNTAVSTATGTCTGCPTRWFDQTTGLNANRGIQPTWFPGPLNAHTLPQTTNVSGLGLTIDVNSTIGLLYHVSNGGGTFQVVLGFTDATSVTVTCSANDWFGATNPPGASAGVASQTRLGGTTYAGTGNRDLPSFPSWPSESLSVTEALITPTSLANAGMGNVVGKTLSSITFQNINQPNRGYAIFASTVTTGVPGPSNDDCAAPLDITLGTTATNSNTALGSSTSACGTADTADVWFRLVAPATQPVEARICGASFDTTIAVYTTCGGSAIACNDNGCFLGSRVTWPAVAGQSYLIRVAGNNGGRGSFNLELVGSPTVNNDVTIPLALNWNGMAHVGETGQPDAPAGFRSISDRGIYASGAAGSLNAGTTIGDNFMPYAVSDASGALDIVHIGLTGPGTPHAWDCSADADNQGIVPTWLTNIDQSGPQRTDLNTLNKGMGANTQVGVLYQVSNGGGFFDVTLEFGDGTSVSVNVGASDWFGAQNPPVAGPGVELQHMIGTFSATDNQDTAATGAVALNVVEAVFSTQSLNTAGLGDHTGKRLTGIRFENASGPDLKGYAIFAATLRNPVNDTTSAPPAGAGNAAPAAAEASRSTLLTVAVSPGQNPVSSGLAVTADLQAFGGSATQSFFDNGTNGDVTAGDRVYSYSLAIPPSQPLSSYSVQFTVSDAQARSDQGTIDFSVTSYAWNELSDGGGDAGDLPSSAFVPVGSGALDSLAGTLCDSDVDMFQIEICDVSLFTASTVGNTGGDTQLFLFNMDGTGVSYNDDSVGVQSSLSNIFVTQPGNYLLAVSIWDRDPVDATGQVLWNDAGGEVAPDGPGAANPVASWLGTTGAAGAYRVTFTGACFPTVGCSVTCDYNDDGGGDNADLTDLADAIASGTDPFPNHCKDYNQDGGADNADVTDMANDIASGTCP